MFNKKYVRMITGAMLTLALAGTMLMAGNAAAQTPPTGGATTPAASTSTTPASPGVQGQDGFDGRGRHGGGPGFGGPGFGGPGFGGPGFDGPGGRGPGRAATVDSATNAISRSEQFLTNVKSDLTYATGKMNTAQVQTWLAAADTFLTSAKTAQTATQYAQAGAYSEAAQSVTATADLVMAQTLGADKLPSYSLRPQHDGRGGAPDTASTTAPTQAQASRDLLRTYNQILSTGAIVGANADAQGYLTQAQAAYKSAYDAYGAGNYQTAHNEAAVAGHLLRVTDSLLHLANAGTSPDAPVTVPAPKF